MQLQYNFYKWTLCVILTVKVALYICLYKVEPDFSSFVLLLTENNEQQNGLQKKTVDISVLNFIIAFILQLTLRNRFRAAYCN